MHSENHLEMWNEQSNDTELQPINHTSHDWNATWNNNNLALGRPAFDDIIQVKYFRIPFALLNFTVILLAIIANFTLIVYILASLRRTKNRPRMRRNFTTGSVVTSSPTTSSRRANVTTYLVLNLACCDLVSACTHHPLLLVDMLSSVRRSSRDDEAAQIFCLVAGFFGCFLSGVAYHTIVAIVQERHLLICFPLLAKRWLTHRLTRVSLLIIWTVGLCASLPLPLRFSVRMYIRLKSGVVYAFCLSMDIFESGAAQYYYVFMFLLYYVIPTIAIAVVNVRIFLTLNRSVTSSRMNSSSHSSNGGGGGDSSSSSTISRMMQRRKSLAKMFLALAILFAILEGPYFAMFLRFSLGYRHPRNPIATRMFLELMQALRTLISPLVYLCRTYSLRRSVRRTAEVGADEDDNDSSSLTGSNRNRGLKVNEGHENMTSV